MLLLAGIATFAMHTELAPQSRDRLVYQSVLSQLIMHRRQRLVLLRHHGFYTAVACTAGQHRPFADFPRLSPCGGPKWISAVLIAYSVTQIGLPLTEILMCSWLFSRPLLLFIFEWMTDRLIPLFAIGAFLLYSYRRPGWGSLEAKKGPTFSAKHAD